MKLISEQIDILVNAENRDMQNVKGNVEPIYFHSPRGVFVGTQLVRASQMNTIKDVATSPSKCHLKALS